MIILAYPFFLLIFIFLLTRRYREMSLLQWIGRWLLAITLAYSAAFGLMTASILLFNAFPGYGYFDRRLDPVLWLYWAAFIEGFGPALVLLALALLLRAANWFQRRSKRESSANDAGTSSLRKIAWLFTILFATSLALVMFLLIEPYFDYQANIDRVYEATRGCCLDPMTWFPFSGEGLGTPLYHLSLWVWSFAAFFIAPIIFIQVVVLKRIWPNIQHAEKITHAVFTTTSVFSTVFVLTIGIGILSWLLD
jgi:hypothetical protein